MDKRIVTCNDCMGGDHFDQEYTIHTYRVLFILEEEIEFNLAMGREITFHNHTNV